MKTIRSLSFALLSFVALNDVHADLQPVNRPIPVTPAWFDRYTPSGFFDAPFDVVVDSQGNAHVTGISVGEGGPLYLTVKYNEQGKKLWTATTEGYPAAQAIDASGNVYVTGDNGTVKYDGNGNQLWATEADETLTIERIAVDAIGNVYVAGYREDEFGGTSSATLKYDADGLFVWERNVPEFYIIGLKVDGSGNVCVGGTTGPSIGNTSIQVVKYAGNGDVVYDVSYAFNRSDLMNAMAMDSAGNVYLTGSSLEYDTAGLEQVNFMTVKFGILGDTWVKYFDGLIHRYDEAVDVETDSEGNVYITGFTTITKSGVQTIQTIKYDAAGNTLWEKRYTGPKKFAVPMGLAVDHQNNVYITGVATDKTTDFGTVKYGPDGTQLWSTTTGGFQPKEPEFAAAQDIPSSIAVDNQGGVYVVGFLGGFDGFAWGVAKYKQNVASGIYNGLFYETTGVSQHSSGFVTLKAGTNGSYSGKLLFDGDAISFSGKVNDLGFKPIFRGKVGKEDLRLSVGFNNPGQLTGTLTSANCWESEITAEFAPFSKTNNTFTLTNQYTMLLPESNAAETFPVGYGFAAFEITTNGLTKFKGGSTADGQTLKQAVGVSASGLWPFYVRTHKGIKVYNNLLTDQVKTNKSYYYGSVLGWINLAGETASGNVSLIKTETTNGLYQAGYTNISEAYAQRYFIPGPGTNTLGSSEALVELSGGNLPGIIQRTATISGLNKVVVSPTNNFVKITIAPKTGALNGTFIHPANNSKVRLRGMIMQGDQFGGGYFLGTDQSGKFTLDGN